MEKISEKTQDQETKRSKEKQKTKIQNKNKNKNKGLRLPSSVLLAPKIDPFLTLRGNKIN